ncbi:hypothetical protein V6N12_045748 [Hibiscus sabdariffa]|uniref:Uncharacterized protein n=1 Tax=Hibiscus sabdariffa TaxID=183260 RepID=A0ABR2G3V0_9ROSI
MNSAKKGRSDSPSLVVVGDAIDADGELNPGVGVKDGTPDISVVDFKKRQSMAEPNGSGKASYASVVDSGSGSLNSKATETKYVAEEVVVLEEDVIIDRRRPSLRASSATAPVSTATTGSRFATLETIEEESGIVAAAQQIIEEPSTIVLGKSPVRSKVVPIQKEVVKNAVYISSNLDRQLRSKSTKTAGIPNPVEVIPTVAGGLSGVRSQKSKGKGVPESSSRGLKVKRTGEFWASTRPILVELDRNRLEHFRTMNTKEILDPGDPSRMVDTAFQSSDDNDFLEWYEEDEMADAEGAQQTLAQ